jgi:putative membrane protein insertion efficiency factor
VTSALLDVTGSVEVHRRPATRAAVSAVRAYQAMRGNRPSPCRFVPSCSEYALDSLERHGFRRGTWLAVRRVCRCRPLGGFGSDPVPD